MAREMLHRPVPVQASKKPEPIRPVQQTLQPISQVILPKFVAREYSRLELQRLKTVQRLKTKHQLAVRQNRDLEIQRQNALREQIKSAVQRQKILSGGGTKNTRVVNSELMAIKDSVQLQKDYQQARVVQRQQQQTVSLEQHLRRPDVPMQRGQNPTLAGVSEHFITETKTMKAAKEEQYNVIQRLKSAGKTLIAHARVQRFPMIELASAIQRFTDPLENTAVRASAFSALGMNPSMTVELQRALADNEANFEVQKKADQKNSKLEEEPQAGISARISALLSGGNPLPAPIRKQLELHFNTDLSKVKVHTDRTAHELAKKVNAIAFTTGNSIFFQAGKFEPDSSAGFELLAHEVTHTIQQEAGLVSAGIDSSPSLEVAAQLEGQKAVANKSVLEQKSNTLKNFMGFPKPLEPKALSSPINVKNVQRSLETGFAVQRKAATTPTQNSINRLGGAHDTAGVNLRDKPSPDGKFTNLPQGTLFFVSNELEGGWYQIKVTSSPIKSLIGKTGFIAAHLVKLAPEKNAVMHIVKAGESAIGIAGQYFKANVTRGYDLRFFVNILHHINPEAMPNPSGSNWQDNIVLKNYAIWIPSNAFAQTLRTAVKSGSITGGAYDAVKDSAEAMVKATIGQLPGGKQVLETIQSIGANARKVLNNPGAFVSNLGKAVGEGFNDFSANLPQHLEKSVVNLFTGTMGNIDLPKIWDATGVLHVGLQMTGFAPEQLEQKLVKEVGGQGNIDKVIEAKNLFTRIQKDGLAVTAKDYFKDLKLETLILGGIKDYVLKTVIKQGMIALGSMFIPGAGIIQAAIKLYETIKFIWDKMKDIAATINAITSSLADIASGKIGSAAQKITSSLVGILGLGIGFLARVAKLDGIATKVRALFDKVKKPIQTAIDKFINWFKNLVLGKGSSKPGAGAKPVPSSTQAAVVHDAKVKAGLKAIDAEEARLDAKDNDLKLTREQAQQVATNIKRAHPVFTKINVHYNVKTGTNVAGHAVTKPEIIYEWFASHGARVSSRKPYTSDLEPAIDEGTQANPFPIDWAKPASIDYPTIYLGGQRNLLPIPNRFVSQSDLKNKVGQNDDLGVQIKAYKPHQRESLPSGEVIGLTSSNFVAVSTVIGPLAKKGITTPGGRKIVDLLKKYGFNPTAEQMDGDHVREIQVGGADMLENLWMLNSQVNQLAGGILDRSEITLKSGKKPKFYQLREYLLTANRNIYFKINSTL